MRRSKPVANVPGYIVANASIGALLGINAGAALLTSHSHLVRLLLASEEPFVPVALYLVGFATTFATVVGAGAIMHRRSHQ